MKSNKLQTISDLRKSKIVSAIYVSLASVSCGAMILAGCNGNNDSKPAGSPAAQTAPTTAAKKADAKKVAANTKGTPTVGILKKSVPSTDKGDLRPMTASEERASLSKTDHLSLALGTGGLALLSAAAPYELSKFSKALGAVVREQEVYELSGASNKLDQALDVVYSMSGEKKEIIGKLNDLRTEIAGFAQYALSKETQQRIIDIQETEVPELMKQLSKDDAKILADWNNRMTGYDYQAVGEGKVSADGVARLKSNYSSAMGDMVASTEQTVATIEAGAEFKNAQAAVDVASKELLEVASSKYLRALEGTSDFLVNFGEEHADWIKGVKITGISTTLALVAVAGYQAYEVFSDVDGQVKYRKPPTH